MRRLLMVLYYFPPAGGISVQRGLKFLRYLPQFGWQPTVLTVRPDAAYPVRDDTLLAEVPADTPIVRTRCPELYGLYRWLTGMRGERHFDVTSQADEDASPMRRLLRWIRAAVFLPDGRMAWRPFGVHAGRALLHATRHDALFSSGPPFTAHLIGRDLQRHSGLPWIADYRDPWTQAVFYPDRPPLARCCDERLEASCVRHADLNLVVGRGMHEEFRARYPDVPHDRWSILTNGYDEEDFAGLPFKLDDTLRITHSGSLFASRAPDHFLRAVAELARREPGFAESVRLCFVGRVDPGIRGRLVRDWAPPQLELIGLQSHRASLAWLRHSRLLLLPFGNDERARGIVTGKVFEYLAAGIPILALGPPDSDVARILEETGAGWTHAPDDQSGIARRLAGIWNRWRAAQHEAPHASAGRGAPAGGEAVLQFGLTPDSEQIARYSRRRLTERLAAHLDALVDRHRGAR